MAHDCALARSFREAHAISTMITDTRVDASSSVLRPGQQPLRNVAIIAHVDHGKTTLVDGLLKQANIFRDPAAAGTLIMDSNDLERERGITILSKNTSIIYNGIKINIIDTPGHADFGGEVERVLSMADGCLLLVDAVEGPMPQTRTVLQRALELHLLPIVVVNKVDRPAARPDEVVSLTQDLFLELATDSAQLDFPVLFSIAREGHAGWDPNNLSEDLRPLLDAIVDRVPPPDVDLDAPARMLVASLDYDNHLGRIAIGRIHSGSISPGNQMVMVSENGIEARQRIGSLASFDGLKRTDLPVAYAGDIVAVAGFPDAKIGSTLASPDDPRPLATVEIAEPTLKLSFGVNTSPFAGREAKFSTSRQLRERLNRELETNLSLRVESTDQADVFAVSGRGELHLSILIETMRREGYEFQVSRPEVITKEVDGQILEPIEHLVIDTAEPYVGVVTELVGGRKAQMMNMVNDGRGNVRLEFSIPTRGLIGLRNAFLTATKGNGVMASRLIGFEPWQGAISNNRSGALLASETGVVTAHGIANAQERGVTFVDPQTEVYAGMIVGQQPRADDLVVNICRKKQLTNIRSSTSDIAIKLTPSVVLSLEQALDFLADDELLEVTPGSFRLRKRLLNESDRAKERKRSQTPGN